MPTSLVSKDQIAVVNQLLKKKWDNGGQHHITQDAALELPIPATPDDMTPEHYSRSIAVDVSTVEDATANYRMARFVIIGGGNVNVAVLFYNLVPAGNRVKEQILYHSLPKSADQFRTIFNKVVMSLKIETPGISNKDLHGQPLTREKCGDGFKPSKGNTPTVWQAVKQCSRCK